MPIGVKASGVWLAVLLSVTSACSVHAQVAEEGTGAAVGTPTLVPVQRPSPSPVVRQLQQALIELGYTPGSPDGHVGTRTRAAMESFCQDARIACPASPAALLPLVTETRMRRARDALADAVRLPPPDTPAPSRPSLPGATQGSPDPGPPLVPTLPRSLPSPPQGRPDVASPPAPAMPRSPAPGSAGPSPPLPRPAPASAPPASVTPSPQAPAGRASGDWSGLLVLAAIGGSAWLLVRRGRKGKAAVAMPRPERAAAPKPRPVTPPKRPGNAAPKRPAKPPANVSVLRTTTAGRGDGPWVCAACHTSHTDRTMRLCDVCGAPRAVGTVPA